MKFDYIAGHSTPEFSRRSRMRRSVLLAVLSAVSIAGLTTHEGTASRHKVQLIEPLAELSSTTQDSAALAEGPAPGETVDLSLDAPQDSEWISVDVRPGQTISTLIEAQGMLKYEWIELMSLGKDVKQLRSLRAGDQVLMRKDAENRLDELVFELDELRTLQVRRVEGKLESIVLTAELERRTTEAQGIITSSLFADGAKAGLSDSLIIEMANILNYDIDFAQDLRDGDRFSVVYEQLYRDGEKLRDGRILAVEFVNHGKVHRAMRHVGKNGQIAYFTPDGQSLRKAFMRTPVDFARISSGFNLKRRHPILNVIRAHKGVDYAARTGTPVKASGDGRVEFLGVKSGYGRVIILQHGSRRTTLYGHLSKFRPGLRKGGKVTKGQVIGYVGQTGLATAPHLHYEFRVNGVHKNPMSVVLPRANGLNREQLAQWRKDSAAIIAQLDKLSASQVAMAQAASPGKASKK